MARDNSLTHNKLLFISEYCSVMPRNATQAYLRVHGCGYDTARAMASNLIADPIVGAEIERWETELRGKMQFTAEQVIDEITKIAFADPAELIDSRLGACRSCYGDGFKPQRTPEELRQALIQYHDVRRRSKLPPDPLGLEFDYAGGVGFNRTLAPNSACPECNGEGVPYERVKDTRSLSPGARRLYDGVKRTKDGLEVKVRDRSQLLIKAAEHLGLLKKDVNVRYPDGIPPITTVSTVTNDPVEAAKIYQSMITQT